MLAEAPTDTHAVSASRNPTRASRQEYFPAFDALRIVLATVVAFAHSGIPMWWYAGDLAVQVFFALSGWLIGGILIRSKPEDLPKFYFHRAARIWIPYFIAIALLVSASLLKDRIAPKWFEFVFYDVTFVYNFFGPPQMAASAAAMPLAGTGNHFWSICAEEQFYLLAPFLITVPARIGRTIWFWCLLSAIALASPFWNYFGAISLGVLAAVVRSRIGDWQANKVAMAALAAIVVVSFVATYTEAIVYRVGAPIVAISTVLLLAQAGRHSAALIFLGGVSFPMYLNHWIGVFIVNAALWKFGLQKSATSQVLSVVVALLVASGLYICVDRMIKQRRDQYFTPRRGVFIAAFGFVLVAIGMVGGLLYGSVGPA